MTKRKGIKSNHSARLIRIRQALGFSQREMAEQFGVVHGAVGLWEAGRRRIPGPVLKLMDLYEEELGLFEPETTGTTLDSLKTGWLSRTVRLTGAGTHILGRVVLDALFRLLKTDEEEDGLIRRKTKETIAMRIVETFGELKGLPHKVGQLMSYMDLDSPPEVRILYSELQYLTPPIRPSVIAEVIVEEFGKTPNQLFKEWEPVPFAAASIGQLHRALTHDGHEVAVKVQYPGIKNVIRSDLKNASLLDRLCTMLVRGQEPESLLEELTERFLGECDYSAEAKNQMEMYNLYKTNKDIVIPKVFEKLSSDRVLTMELMNFPRYGDFMKSASQSQINVAGLTIWKHAFDSTFANKMFNADPHPGNYLFPERGVVFLDYGCVKRIPDDFFKHWKKFITSIINDDKQAMSEEINEMGIVSKRDKFNYDRFYKLMREWYYPCYADEEFKFSREFVSKHWKEMKSWNPRKMHMKFPKELFFLNQLQWGIYAVLADMGAKANWSRHFSTLLK